MKPTNGVSSAVATVGGSNDNAPAATSTPDLLGSNANEILDLTGESAIAGILDSMDIRGLSEKYCVALKQSLLLAFLYLVVAVCGVLIVLVAALNQVGTVKNLLQAKTIIINN